MVSQTRQEEARRRAIALFESVKIGALQYDCRVWRVIKSSEQARKLRVQPRLSGLCFGTLKHRLLAELSLRVDSLRPNSAKSLREQAWEVAEVCAGLIESPDTAVTEPWLEDVHTDACGVFLSSCFPAAVESAALFDLVRAGYEAGGFPCGLPSWPASRIAIFAASSVDTGA